jgi:FliI/YscN family ATPase
MSLADGFSLRNSLETERRAAVAGRITGAAGLLVTATLPDAFVGELCHIHVRHGDGVVRAEVVGFRHGETLLMPLGELRGVGVNCHVSGTGSYLKVPVGDAVKGRILNGLGELLDGEPIVAERHASVHNEPPHPMRRPRIRRQLEVGVRAIDALLPCGEGQRVGIFAAAGGGKSTLMGMIAQYAKADERVIVLVGERGREVREFVEDSLGSHRGRSVVVAATSDQPPLVRMKAAYAGVAIAEHFRDLGRKVILMVDSVTRFARAQREVGLARGEPPARYGFPPSVFAELPRLFERCGNAPGGGSITGFYTVLVEGDNMDEPVADESRGLLDGHIVLSPKVGYRPAIDLLASESRVKGNLQLWEGQKEHMDIVQAFLWRWHRDEQEIDFGFTDRQTAERMKAQKRAVDAFMQQQPGPEGVSLKNAAERLRALAASLPDLRLKDGG